MHQTNLLTYMGVFGLSFVWFLRGVETLRPHEYDIPVVRGGQMEGPDVFGFLIHSYPSEIWPQT